jgi:hypothetical protein
MMMEQVADNKRGWRAMECSCGGIGDGSNDKGGDSGGKGKDSSDGCSKCNGNGSGDGDGHEDGNGHNNGCVEGNGLGNAATAAAATVKATKMRQSQPPANAKNQQSAIKEQKIRW